MRSPRGYPLSAMFVTVTVCAVSVTMWSVLARSNWSIEELIITTFVSGLVGSFVGGNIGLFHYRRRWGYLCGLLAGGVTGMIMGPLLLSDQRGLEALFAAQLGGGIVVLVTAVLAHFVGRSKTHQSAAAKVLADREIERARFPASAHPAQPDMPVDPQP